tara:strand:+ start:968 stop:1240 length:273 start_codon:yes stop_codon:yes gene_type:complete
MSLPINLLSDEVFVINNNKNKHGSSDDSSDNSSDYKIERLSPPREKSVRRASTPLKTRIARGKMKIKKRKTRKTRKTRRKGKKLKKRKTR